MKANWTSVRLSPSSSLYMKEEGDLAGSSFPQPRLMAHLEYKVSERSYCMDPWLRDHFSKVLYPG